MSVLVLPGISDDLNTGRKENAKLACESVFGVNNCVTDACGFCNNRAYHSKDINQACGGVTMWNYASKLIFK